MAAGTQSPPKPQPRLDPLNCPHWEHAREGRLAVQACEECGDLHYPPSPICPNCNGERQSWRVVGGRGTLESWVAFHRPYWPGFTADLPYDVCLVRLEEGPVVVSNLVGGTEGARIGAPVRVVFEREGEGATLPKWTIVRD